MLSLSPERKARRAAQARLYRLRNKEKVNERQRAYRLENKERIKERNAAYRAEHPEKMKAARDAWVRNNPEKVKAHTKRSNEARRKRRKEDAAYALRQSEYWKARHARKQGLKGPRRALPAWLAGTLPTLKGKAKAHIAE